MTQACRSLEPQANLVYVLSSRPALLWSEAVSQNKKQNQTKAEQTKKSDKQTDIVSNKVASKNQHSRLSSDSPDEHTGTYVIQSTHRDI